jgi:hypothetical protein
VRKANPPETGRHASYEAPLIKHEHAANCERWSSRCVARASRQIRALDLGW